MMLSAARQNVNPCAMPDTPIIARYAANLAARKALIEDLANRSGLAFEMETKRQPHDMTDKAVAQSPVQPLACLAHGRAGAAR